MRLSDFMYLRISYGASVNAIFGHLYLTVCHGNPIVKRYLLLIY